VPTGMNIGVSEVKCGSVRREVLARPHCARTWKVRAGDSEDGSSLGFILCVSQKVYICASTDGKLLQLLKHSIVLMVIV
jgi:hypothetical protein